MSASPDPEEVASELPISPDEAEAIAAAMDPVQDLLNAGASGGEVVQSLPGAGPSFIGTLAQGIAAQVNAASVTVETVARALRVYVELQGDSLQSIFPPPEQAFSQVQSDLETFQEAVEAVANRGPGGLE